MRNTIYYKWFIDSLREDQKKDYQQMSINQQKDWYIRYLESKYSSKDKPELGTIKVVINSKSGGFAISKEAAEFMAKEGCKIAKLELETKDYIWSGFGMVYDSKNDIYYDGYDRTSQHLIKAVETLGDKANDSLSSLQIVEVPDNVEFYIFEYDDGSESIHEKHRTWR
jgi:hypothetical protein